ncbi:hypothetical protein Tco_0746697 [Tanacetum coccineum]
MSSRVSKKVVNTTEPPRNSKPFLNSKNLACPTCNKCIYTANHDACILQNLSEVNSRASAQKKDAAKLRVGLQSCYAEESMIEKDQKWTDKIVQMIDNMLLERRIMRILECFVGGRAVETDYRLLMWTV